MNRLGLLEHDRLSLLLVLILSLLAVGAAGTASAQIQQQPTERRSVIDIRPLPDPDRPATEPGAPWQRVSPRTRGAGSAAAAKPGTAPATRLRSIRSLKRISAAGGRVSYYRGFVRGVGVHVIEAAMRHPDVRIGVMLARGGVGRTETFPRMMARARPTAAITGTFFGLNNREPTGDLVINGEAAWRGFIGTAVAITSKNTVAFVPTRYKDTSVDWSRYETVIRGGPSLLTAGEFSVSPQTEGFFSLGEFSRRWRTAVGVTRDNRLLLVAVRQGITFWELAKVMYSLGAMDAVALDGGSSTAMYFSGKVRVKPGRSMTNVLMIYSNRAHYDAMRPQFGGQRRPQAAAAAPSLRLPSLTATQETFDGSGFEPAMPDPALPRADHYRLNIQIAPASPQGGPVR